MSNKPGCAAANNPMIFQDKQTVVFIGDSITDCGRPRPSTIWNAELGGGYVAQCAALLAAHRPEVSLGIVNSGLSGNRITDLAARWEEDVFGHQPDWVSVMIGINDVWRHFDRPFLPQVSRDEFRTTLSGLVKMTLPRVRGMILLTPFYLEAHRGDPMRKMMDAFGAVVREVAEAEGTLFGDTQAAFDDFLKSRSTQSLCGDRVHPNTIGHAVLARVFLNTIGFRWASP